MSNLTGITFLFFISFFFLLFGCGTPTRTTQGTGGTSTKSTSRGSAAFQQLQSSVLTPKCASCHQNSAQGSAGFGVGTYVDVMNSGFVIAGNATGSRLCQVVSKRQMPPSGTLSTSSINAICQWIQNGAL